MTESTAADPFRETVVIADGPNASGQEDMAVQAHRLPPDPANVDDTGEFVALDDAAAAGDAAKET